MKENTMNTTIENKELFEAPEIEIVLIEADVVSASGSFDGEWDSF